MSIRRIEIAGASSYAVVICDDAREAILAHLADRFPQHARCVISDDVVAPLYARGIERALATGDAPTRLLTFPSGESSKSREVWALLGDAMFDARFGRDTVVVAVGGGVTGDLAGFVAATYMRGVPIVHVPTSLVAMVDAAVGGKTGLDVPAGKNLMGAFHAPDAVIVDPGALRTLPVRHLKEGLVEAVKHGAIADADYFDWIFARARALACEGGPDGAEARRLVERSIEIKAAVVSEDPLEQGRRAVLNFGHTIAHAIERATGYAASHGQAVAHGMIAEARIGEAMGVTETGTAARIEQAVGALELPPLPAFDRQDFLHAAGADKKNRGGAIRASLLRRIGDVARADDGAWTHAVPLDLLQAAVA
ncbi:MAG TPA: 3-dehydroquinate synthase [Longimicrobiales bacterium]|nr:3-dehydroquinate synthase [Longimicrobiales bacterium]